jgi:hypothetical protein
MRLFTLLGFSALAQAVLQFESIQLQPQETKEFPAVAFAADSLELPKAKCKGWPGTEGWPSNADWKAFNETIDGKLLKPRPPGVVCYQGPDFSKDKCSYLINNASTNNFYVEDPLAVLTQWPQGSTCWPALNASGECKQGGYPTYVVNATTVKHVQAAVNFARNRNLRLVIKSVPATAVLSFPR